MGLFTPIWMKKELNAKQEEKAYAKIRNMDEESLAAVVKTAPNANIRGYAVKRIKDQQTLAWVAQNSSPYSIRLYAVQKLEDEPLLARIALNDDNESVRSAALEKVTDQKLLGAIAKKVKYTLRHHHNALDRIKDDAVLEDVALHSSDNITAFCAVERIEDRDALCRIYDTSHDETVRATAVEGLAKMHYSTDLLYKIALSNCSSKVFGTAFNAINHVIMQTKVEDADTLSDDAVACMIKAMQNSGANCREWPTVSEKIALLLKALYRDGKHCPAIKVLNKRSYRKHTDYHADCSCAQWGHEDVNYIFKLDDNK